MNFNNKTGLFWIENNKKIFGSIDVMNSFYILNLDNKLEYEGNYVIYGEIDKKEYTFLVKSNHYNNDYFVIDFIFEGVFFRYRNDIKLDNVTFKLSNLNYWRLNYIVKEDIRNRGCVAKIGKNNVETFVIDKNVTLEIKQAVTKTMKSNGTFLLTEEPILTLKFNEITDFDIIMEKYVYNLYYFFRFVIKETNVHDIKVIYSKKINIYTNYFKDSTRNFNRRHILFNRVELEKYHKTPEKIFSRWFNIRNKLKPVFDVYFSVLNSRLYAETEFLSLMQILEAYHRRREDKYDLNSKTNKEYKNKYHDNYYYELNKKEKNHEYNIFTRIRSILTILDVKFVNQIIDRKLINEQETPGKLFYKKYIEDISKICLERHKKIYKFTHIICNNRHYYTHYNKDENYKKALIGVDLLKTNDYLIQIIDICILYELYFPLSADLDIFKKIIDEKIYH